MKSRIELTPLANLSYPYDPGVVPAHGATDAAKTDAVTGGFKIFPGARDTQSLNGVHWQGKILSVPYDKPL